MARPHFNPAAGAYARAEHYFRGRRYLPGDRYPEGIEELALARQWRAHLIDFGEPSDREKRRNARAAQKRADRELRERAEAAAAEAREAVLGGGEVLVEKGRKGRQARS